MVFALGIKHTEECYPILVSLLDDPDYGIRADAAGALGYWAIQEPLNPWYGLLRRHRMVSTLQVRQCHWVTLALMTYWFGRWKVRK